MNGEYIGYKPSPEMSSYHGAKVRCENPNSAGYADYGGRGIEFRFDSFEAFLAAVGRRPTPEHSLDRIDVNGHYELGNVRWATRVEQARNKRNTRLITYQGETKSLAEWAEVHTQIRWRLPRQWCVTCAIEAPSGSRCAHRKEQQPA